MKNRQILLFNFRIRNILNILKQKIADLVRNLRHHLFQHVVKPEDVSLRVELLPVVIVLLLHLPEDVKLIISVKLIIPESLEERGCEVVEDDALVHGARHPGEREVDDCGLHAAGLHGVGASIQLVVHAFPLRLLSATIFRRFVGIKRLRITFIKIPSFIILLFKIQ